MSGAPKVKRSDLAPAVATGYEATKKERTKERHADTDGLSSSNSSFVRSYERASGLPTLNPKAWHGPIADFLDHVAAGTEADPLAIHAQILAAAGNLIGPDTYVMLGADRHPPLLWPLIVGSTATGRKGTSEGLSVQPLYRLDGVRRLASGLSSGEGIIAAFQQPDDDDAPPVDPRLVVVESEWESVLARARREGNTLSAVLRAAWDANGPLSTMNVDARRADRHHLTVVGHITPHAMRDGVTALDASNGFLNRFLPLLVARPRLLAWPAEIPPAAEEILTDMVAKVRVTRAGKRALDPHAVDAYTAWYLRFEQERERLSERVALASARASGHLIRAALILSAIDGTDEVRQRHIEAAAALVEYSLASAWVVFGPGRAGIDRKILEALRDKPLTRTEVWDLFNRNLPKAHLEQAINDLLEAHLIAAEAVNDTGGRSATRYRLTTDHERSNAS